MSLLSLSSGEEFALLRQKVFLSSHPLRPEPRTDYDVSRCDAFRGLSPCAALQSFLPSA